MAAARRQAAAPLRPQTVDSNSEPAQASASSDGSFEAAVLTRLARRGHAALIAQAAWKAMRNAPAAGLVDLRHTIGAGRGRSTEDEAASPVSPVGSTVDEDAMSDRRASHAEASIPQSSHTATDIDSRRHHAQKGIAASLHRMPLADMDEHSEKVEREEPIAARKLWHREGVDIIGQLLCQLAGTQALERILAALLLEAPSSDSHSVAQVSDCEWTDFGLAVMLQSSALNQQQ